MFESLAIGLNMVLGGKPELRIQIDVPVECEGEKNRLLTAAEFQRLMYREPQA
jgi:hypothetical protein